MVLLLLPLPGNEAFCRELATALDCDTGVLELRRFPDGESHVRLRSDVSDRDVALVCTLSDPDAKLAPLLFAADAARELGVKRVGLVAPYLGYMRQDRRFQPGEAVTSRTFARILSSAFDWMVTVDPHLHRYRSLCEIYSIPTRVAHAGPALAGWIKAHVDQPLIVGPDAESEQWVAEVAKAAGAPHVTFSKTRYGDRDVRIEAPDLTPYSGMQPVLVDDIASSGQTLAQAANQLIGAGLAKPRCLIVHALYASGAAEALAPVTSGLFSSDTIPHPSNRVTVAPQLAEVIGELANGPHRLGQEIRPSAADASGQQLITASEGEEG